MKDLILLDDDNAVLDQDQNRLQTIAMLSEAGLTLEELRAYAAYTAGRTPLQ